MVLVRLVEPFAIDEVIGFVNEYATATRAEAGESESEYPSLACIDDLGATTGEAVAVADAVVSMLRQGNSAAVRLNEMADVLDLTHRLGDTGRLEWFQRGSHGRLEAATVTALIEFMHESGAARLGFCAADRCVDIFADRSRAARRRYCSNECSARRRVAQWRTRQRAETDL
jgi:hypothetical protein